MNEIKKEFSLKKINDYIYKKQYILPNTQIDSIKKVSENLIGLHSARLPTAFVTLHSRLNNFKTEDLQIDLYKNKEVIKLRCMRKTLHIVPLEMASIVHNATLHFRLTECLSVYKKFKIDNIIITIVKSLIIKILKTQSLKTNDIVNKINNNLTFQKYQKEIIHLSEQEKKVFLKTVIKHLWEDGTLCYINSHSHWGSENRLFGCTKNIYPKLNLNNIKKEEAQQILIAYHIEKYGPVTEKDISWWSGLGKTIIQKTLEKLSKKLVCIKIENMDYKFYMLEKDFNKLNLFQETNKDWLSLLAHEDPSLKGYYESRNRYIDDENYNKLFNPIGEARASIILNGKIIGLWEWDKKEKRINYSLFSKLDLEKTKVLHEKIYNLEHCLHPKTPTLF